LVERYSSGITLRDEVAIASVFLPDGVWRVAAPFEVEIAGSTAIASAICGSLAGMDLILHMVHSVVIDLDGDEATARTIIHEVARAADRSTGLSMFGVFEDRVARINGKWLFRLRNFRPIYIDRSVPTGDVFNVTF
jgi:hypothetical protein